MNLNIRLLSYNIHKGFSANNQRFVLNEMRLAIRTVNADLVFLQEVLGHHSNHAKKFLDWPKLPQFEFLADTIWSHHAYGKNAVYDEGHHGNAILSKYPFVSCENIDISTNRFEKRGILHGVIDIVPTQNKVHVICLHLNLLESGRVLQIRSLIDRIQKAIPNDAPLIIAGDFNDWTGNVGALLKNNLGLVEVFEANHGRPARTYPSRWPLLRLDRIYTRGFKIKDSVSLTGNPWNLLSDHTALYTELGI